MQILYDNLSEKKAFKIEKELISLIRMLPNSKLTNICDGGEGSSGWKANQEFKDKQSMLSKIRWQNDAYKNKMIELRNADDSVYKSEEFRNKISNLVSGKNNPNYHHFWTTKMKINLSDLRKKNGLSKGVLNNRATKIICLETGEIFDLIQDAQIKYHIHDSTSITAALKEPYRTAGGLHWRYYDNMYLNENCRFEEIVVSLQKSSRLPIVCKETKEIYNNRQDFLSQYNIGIKYFKNHYHADDGIIINSHHYYYPKDYMVAYGSDTI